MSEFKFDPKKLEETKADLNQALKKFEEIKANYPTGGEEMDICEVMRRHSCMMDSLLYTLQSLQQQVSYISDSFYNHVSQGHLPSAPGPAAMQSAISALGWTDDYQVQPRTIYASLNDGYIKVAGKKIN